MNPSDSEARGGETNQWNIYPIGDSSYSLLSDKKFKIYDSYSMKGSSQWRINMMVRWVETSFRLIFKSQYSTHAKLILFIDVAFIAKSQWLLKIKRLFRLVRACPKRNFLSTKTSFHSLTGDKRRLYCRNHSETTFQAFSVQGRWRHHHHCWAWPGEQFWQTFGNWRWSDHLFGFLWGAPTSFGDFEQHDFWQVQVMRTFGWAPTEGELQELVGEIDQVGARKKILRYF